MWNMHAFHILSGVSETLLIVGDLNRVQNVIGRRNIHGSKTVHVIAACNINIIFHAKLFIDLTCNIRSTVCQV